MDGNTALAGAPQPCGPTPADLPAYEVGYRRPPSRTTFRPGVSGNPMGRPRRAQAGGRVVPAQPTALEHALAEPAETLSADAPVSGGLARAVVARLTRRALNDGDVAACRELLRLVSEAEATATERALSNAERAEAEVQAAEAGRAAAEAAVRKAEQDAQARALSDLRELAGDAARDRGATGFEPDNALALVVLDAVEADLDAGKVTAVKPWVVEAARAHDPDLPHGGDRPLDLNHPDEALYRLRIAELAGHEHVAGWFIDAARARRPEVRFAPGDEALMALVRDDGEDKDWVARLAGVKGMAP